MPVAIRRDWVQNSNDSFWLSNPAIEWRPFSPLVGGTETPQSLRTRTGLHEIMDRLAGTDGIAAHDRVGLPEVQAMLFRNHNHAAHLVLDDLLAICEPSATTPAAISSTAVRDACSVLAAWDRTNNLDSRGAHLFREWWRRAQRVENVWRVPFDPDEPVLTPRGLNTGDPVTRSRLLALLEDSLVVVQAAGFEADAALAEVQVGPTGSVGLHGGMEFEGLLNKLEALGSETLPPGGYRINFGTSYVQAVTFDDDGPVAEAFLTYGQSSLPGSRWAFDQLPLYAQKKWQPLPFHPEDIARARIGPVLRLAAD
jgi:acyl-homoserine-lactone acylase